MGYNQNQILEMVNGTPYGYNQNVVHNGPQVNSIPSGSVQQNTQTPNTIAGNHNSNYDEGLLLKMFGSFCSEQPENSKELAIAFNKFSRWIQSTVDKQNSKN
jgi:hypothetical protein